MDDHIAWLLQQKFFKRALDEAEKHERELKQHSVQVQIKKQRFTESFFERFKRKYLIKFLRKTE